MAEQATVLGTAAQQLKPLQNNNIGAIVQENIRYWNQADTEEEAARKAAAARKAEFQRKQKKDADKRADDYRGDILEDESEGYLNYQSAKLLEKANEVLYKNESRVLSGDADEKFSALQENEQWRNKSIALSKLNKASNEITANTKDADYNPALDYESRDLVRVIKNGGYDLNDQGNLVLIDPYGEKETLEVNPIKLLASVKSMKYSGYTNFDDLGDAEADSITQRVTNGNIGIDAINVETALTRSRNILSDERKLREFAYNTNFGGMQEDPTAYKNFDEDQLNQLAKDFSATYIEPRFKLVREDLRNALDNARLGKIKAEEETKVTAQVRTDDTVVKEIKIGGDQIDLGENEVGYIKKAGGKDVKVNINGDLEATYLGHITDTDGTTTVFAEEKYIVKTPVLDTNGKPVVKQVDVFETDGNGNYVAELDKKGKEVRDGKGMIVYKSTLSNVPETTDETKTRVVKTKNEAVVTSVFGEIDDARGRQLNNAQETARSYQADAKKRLELEKNSKAEKTKTREERIAEMNAAIQGK
jgi:hypothetical protein